MSIRGQLLLGGDEMGDLRRRRPGDLSGGDTVSTGPLAGLSGLKWARSLEDAPDSFDIAWSADGRFLAASGHYGGVTVWPISDELARRMEGHDTSKSVIGLTWHPRQSILATGSDDGTVRLWDVTAGTTRIFCTQDAKVGAISWSPEGDRIAVTSGSGYIHIWDARWGTLLAQSRAHDSSICNAYWAFGGRALVTCTLDGKISIVAARDLQEIRRLNGHTDAVNDITLSPDERLIASSSTDKTVRVWDLSEGNIVAVLEGHIDAVLAISFSPNSKFLASAARTHRDSESDELLLWRCRDWARVATVTGLSFNKRGGLAFHPSNPLLAAKNQTAYRIDCYEVNYAVLDKVQTGPGLRRYGNAKVVLLGDTGVGKSGLGLVLSGQPYQPTDSTHGRNVWTLDAEEVEVPGGGEQTREVLLWDLAGQPGYRIIHQLHMNEIAVALIVFDSRSETDPFSGVKYWARALAQARRLEGSSAVPLKAYLVAARADRGGVGVSAERVRAMVDALDLDGFFETSAKDGTQVTELAQAIRVGIDWDALPTISSSALFDSIKQFLIEEKQQGRLLCTADDLFHGFLRVYPGNGDSYTLRAIFDTCVGRVESRGLIRRLHFGDLVLLQPELLDAYASGMVQAARAEPDGLGFITEEEALAGQFRLADTERVSDRDQEKLLLIATVEELLRHEIALKEITDEGVALVFPSQFTRERPGAPDIPGKEVTFAFEGALHNVYATLAVRLSHSALFTRQAMWQNAASYTAPVGAVCGIHLRELEEGRGELVLFYDAQTSREVRSQFETYVASHLQARALPGTLIRRAVRACSACGYVLPEDLVNRRLERGADTVRCPACEESHIALVEEPAAPADGAVAEMNRRADEHRDRNAAALRLKGKIETGDYDVFMCYSSKDREQVTAIAQRLQERGILPWLDTWEIPPGTRWQKELEKQLKSVKSAAVFIGSKGPGPWQGLEMESLLGQIEKRKRPIIPVILERREGRPRLPAFLDVLHLVDMRQPDPDPFEQLVWGITGERSSRV